MPEKPRRRLSSSPSAPDGAGASLTALRGVGPRVAERLQRLGVRDQFDLLLHRPLRYQDRGFVRPVAQLDENEEATIEGRVVESHLAPGPRRMLLCRLADDSGEISLRFFNAPPGWLERFRPGALLRCHGETRRVGFALEMAHPELLTAGEADEDALYPVYPATEGMHQSRLRGLIRQALDNLEQGRLAFPDLLPDDVVREVGFPSVLDALRLIHRPPREAGVEVALCEGRHPAVRRLAFEELLAQQLALREARARMRRFTAPPMGAGGRLFDEWLAGLPFRPTAAQQRVLEEVRGDLSRAQPMLRLVQGDVGSGKTLVAAGAALHAIEAGWQVALMAPTGLLAEQHQRNLTGWLTPLGLAPVLLSGTLGARARREALARVVSGEAPLVVGTHALFQDAVRFARLGLVIVDEQHRFGVHQRLSLTGKGEDETGGQRPHQLVMTATPIPRTLAMSAYADLDVSVIDELPPGRTPVRTVAIADTRREEVMERLRAVAAEGRQAYWVCPLIEESEAVQAQAAQVAAQMLQESLPELRIALVHGRLPGAEKDAVMNAFKAGAFDVLVATTVIEVGVDVPNASVMVIENAERLGLAQLHQLRGRVGRGAAQSSCVLMYRAPLGERGRARLGLLRETHDGFRIAEEDLRMRGPGEVLGTRQTGLARLRVADLLRDADLLPAVREVADRLLAREPARAEALIARWVGDARDYGKV
ncbi:MAG: ATP-dependent DNA helicase RecG [Pseudomonadota bacterium]